MRGFRSLLSFIIIICSCNSQPQLAPETDTLVDYTKASLLKKEDPKKSCELFSVLSQKTDFVLKDVAYLRTLELCEINEKTDWNRVVPAWLEKQKQLLFFKNIKTDLERALFVQKNPQYFKAPERIQAYQKGLDERTLSAEQKQLLEEALFLLAPRFMPNPSLQDQFRMVKDYRSVRNFDKTKALLRAIITNSKHSLSDRWNAHKEMYLTHRLQKGSRTSAYVTATKNWAEFLKPSQLTTPALWQMYLEAQTTYARVVWTERSTEQAQKILDAIEATAKGKISLHDIYWLRARMFEEKKEHEKAVAEIEKSLSEKIPLWKEREKILWTLAWSYFKEKKFEQAEKYFKELVEHPETAPFAKFKYLYWRGESEQRRGAKDKAQKTWTQLMEEDFFGFYNMLAHHQLQKPLKDYKSTGWKASAFLNEENDKVFHALKKVDEHEMARQLLIYETPDFTQLKNKSSQDISNLFYLHTQVANYKYIFFAFNQLPYPLQKDIFLKIPDLLFPRPYETEINEASNKTGVDTELIYSIMRQESSFDPEARSPMDAFGLLQVLPEVGRRIARANKIPYRGYEDLLDETKNIHIGAQLLKKQIQSFDNKLSLYVASYNASSSVVRNWHKRALAAEHDDLMFIEEIPYEETKAYVKLVFRNYVIYKKMKYGNEFKDFPRDLLKID